MPNHGCVISSVHVTFFHSWKRRFLKEYLISRVSKIWNNVLIHIHILHSRATVLCTLCAIFFPCEQFLIFSRLEGDNLYTKIM